jgi:hypothetical protein
MTPHGRRDPSRIGPSETGHCGAGVRGVWRSLALFRSPAVTTVLCMPIPAAPMAFQTLDPNGPVHAVATLGDRLSLCGRPVMALPGRPWPMTPRLLPPNLDRCPECLRRVYE